jgi:translation initiation factor RLI1
LYAYDKLYENMEADFYEVINKLNGNCIHGYLGFLKEEKTQIAYKSSYIGDIANLEGNKSFEYFFQVSFDMVDYFHFQLN